MQYPLGTVLKQYPKQHSIGTGLVPVGHVSFGGQPPASIANNKKLVARKKIKIEIIKAIK